MKKEKINYWTEIGLAAKKDLQSQKIYDAKKHHRRHPKLSDLTFEKVNPPQERNKEEWKSLFKTMREEAKQRKEKRPYSEYHNKLINNLYGNPVNSLKKSALEATHEERIRSIIIKKEIHNSLKTITRDKDKPNLIIINKEYNWNITRFMCIPSSHNMDTLRRIGIEIAEKLSVSMKNFFDIEIWEKSEYMKHLAGEQANYRYQICKTKH